MKILSHRGLDFDRAEALPENSLSSFRHGAEQGFGIEVDLQCTRDGVVLIAHDYDLKRWSKGRCEKKWKSVDYSEVQSLLRRDQERSQEHFQEQTQSSLAPVCTLGDVLNLGHQFPELFVALHFKGENQSPEFLDRVSLVLQNHEELHSRLLAFDLKPESARFLWSRHPAIGRAASLAHEHDIARFQSMTSGTLLSLDELVSHSSSYDWAWMDEWDRQDQDGSRKALYSESVFAKLKSAGKSLAVISPELHKSENHEDARSLETLSSRWSDILKLRPEALCTDYPTRVSRMSAAPPSGSER